ncbi:hypothetical protein T310_2571 [Rasamsonia emersonii CBS 393.64]|uniref:Palmitoyltransferase n=1 Tax=Rasamsonia emersonii (strain ATCC 16479 / CBS 393.64 / IMI 116815) TaxID=1408163 RepID=A0A0F4Z0K5_RASE3|nr:hypothetical protein T310_2571 [Rasamsonia emersonii CBS 393.64]KKA23398.1 hypothetical protein T310_2571 [Rasamsonia emersonii CBS 393.64]
MLPVKYGLTVFRVGGVVSESSHKFFIQFVFYTAIFCGFNLVVLSIFTAELRQRGHVNAHWLVALGLSCIFFLFSAGMTGTSLHLAATNTTTIENITRKTKVWTLAIHINRPSNTEWARVFPTVTYPSRPISTPVDSSDQDSPKQEDSRTFAILRTQPGENPFDLGSPLKNLQQVMGYTVWDWLLPLKPSPCVDHSSPESAYAMGPVVQRLKREAGLIDSTAEPSEPGKSDRRRHHRRRRNRQSNHRHRPEVSDASTPSGPSEQDESQQQPAGPDREGDSNQ